MKTEINPLETTRAAAYNLLMSVPTCKGSPGG